MKKLLLITLVFMFAFASNALAHTGLETSSPENGEVITKELREISLTFEGKVEQGSAFELSNANGQSIPVEEISIDETLMTGTFPSALENGEYTVVWNIIGADGHPISGEFSFSIDVPVTEKQDESEDETASQDATSQDETQLENVEDTNADEQEQEQEQSPSYLMPVIVILLIVIIVGIFVALRRKK